MFEAVSVWLTTNIQSFGYAAVVFLMGLESANIPIPSEIVMPFAGFLAAQGKMGFHGAALAGGVGCLWGSLVSYWLGRRYGRPFMEKHGRWIFIGPRQMSQGDYLFSRFGGAVSFFSRLLPVVRTFISFVAGVWKVPVGPFALLTFIGSWAWSYLLVYVGYKLGENWTALRPLWHKFDVAIIALAVLGVAVYIWHHWKSTAPKPQPQETTAAPDDGPNAE